jgi:CMP-N,N'-diacetyllegionaminic acid synthase
MPKLVAIVPVRQGSARVKNKNFKSFAGSGKCLLEIKLDVLTQVPGIDEIIVNTDSDVALDIARRHGVGYAKREPYYASAHCTNSEHWRNLAETTDADYVMHTLCTSPLISVGTYTQVLEAFEREMRNGAYDSVNTVRQVKEFLWYDGKPVNYSIGESPNSQNLPEVVALTFGISIVARNAMRERSNVVGYRPWFFVLDEIEAVDIDTDTDFECAEFLYDRHVSPPTAGASIGAPAAAGGRIR